jgi:soluble lytic murein transglycosylase-like protein
MQQDNYMQLEQALDESKLGSKLAAIGLATALTTCVNPTNLKTDYYQAPVSYIQTINPEDAAEETIKAPEPVYTSKWDHLIEKYINQDLYTISQIVNIIQAESEGRPWVPSKAGKDAGLGLVQVSLGLLTDYNDKHHTNIKQPELLDPETNIKIACWFLNSIPKRIGLEEGPVSNEMLEKVYVAYNCGVRSYNNHYDTSYSKGVDPKTGKPYNGITRLNTAKDELSAKL